MVANHSGVLSTPIPEMENRYGRDFSVVNFTFRALIDHHERVEGEHAEIENRHGTEGALQRFSLERNIQYSIGWIYIIAVALPYPSQNGKIKENVENGGDKTGKCLQKTSLNMKNKKKISEKKTATNR